MRDILLIVAWVFIAIALVVGALTYFQVIQEQAALTADLEYRTEVLAESLQESVEPYYNERSTAALQGLVDRFAGRERLVGLAVFDNQGQVVARSKDIPSELLFLPAIATAMDSDSPQGGFAAASSTKLYAHVEPLHNGESVVGAFMVVQSASYIDSSIQSILERNLLRSLLQLLVFILAIAAIVRFAIYRPLRAFVESVRAARMGEGTTVPSNPFFSPLAKEISKMTTSLTAARMSASEEARLRLEKLDSPWTAERLKEFIKAYLKDRPIYVVSNREPYVHTKNRGEITYAVPASGMVTALESVMEACGGLWIAHGSGNADTETADAEGKLRVPPDDPRYTLKRVWLNEEDIEGYYVGFSNEALWPLCHMAHTRPIFREEDWEAYKRVNGAFARTLLQEIKNVQRPLILVQDFHFALLPEMIKKSRPDAQVALFWHIPWPSAEAFSICPFRKEILEGMLGADLVGFHTQQYCNNFLDTVGKEIEALISLEQFSITSEGHPTYVKPFPISVAFTDSETPETPEPEKMKELEITAEFLGLGVDRLDYTKGILERFRGVEFFLDSHPEYEKRFTFLQIAPVSREAVKKYRDYNKEVSEEADRINKKFGENGWKPIVLDKRHYSHAELEALYRKANVCLVTSLHDGMNLVAKEFVAARNDEAGVLILSKFTGAARDLKEALIHNPYSAEDTAEAIHAALTMPHSEQHRRMRAMRIAVRDYNVYRWSAELIRAVANLG